MTNQLRDGMTLTFKASATNTGRCKRKYTAVDLTLNGKPMKAGDLKVGQQFFVNVETGEVEL